MSINFECIKRTASDRADNFLSSFLPGGKTGGQGGNRYYSVKDPVTGEKHESLVVWVNEGNFRNYATGASGGDYIGLYAYINGLEGDVGEAARQLGDWCGITTEDTKESKQQPKGQRGRKTIHESPPPAVWIGKEHGYQRPTQVWIYADEHNEEVIRVYRLDLPDGKKQFRQLKKLKSGWKWGGVEICPPYNLQAILNAPEHIRVVCCEGEKASDAAGYMFQTTHVATTTIQGAQSPKKTDYSKFKDKCVDLWPDNDDAGKQYVLTVARFMLKAGAKEIRILKIPAKWEAKWDAADIFQNNIPVNNLEWELFEDDKTNMGEGEIVCNGTRLSEQGEKALSALQQKNAKNPIIFSYKGRLHRVDLFLNKKGETHLNLTELTTQILRFELENSIDFVIQREDSKTPCPPPKLVCEYILAMRHFNGFPELTRLVASPMVARDGHIIVAPGYDEQTGIFYHEFTPLNIPNTEPSSANLIWAKELIDEFLCDFPFSSKANKANAIALFLLPFCREFIDGVTPLHVISAPAQGSGKTLLANVITKVFNPHQTISSIPEGRDSDNELRKLITTKLMSLASHIFFDNVSGKLESPNLAAVLTTLLWSDRALGQNKEIAVPNQTTWLMTGNNLKLCLDILRRTLEIRLDAQCENPSERTKFKHSNLPRWATEQRGNLVGAAIIFIRYWLAAGQPKTKNAPQMGSFEEWRNTIGGILETVGIDGFLENKRETASRADTTHFIWQCFCEKWHDKHGSNPIKASQLHSIGKDIGMFEEVLVCSKNEAGEITRLGRKLAEYQDRIFSGLKIVRVQNRKNSQYKLMEIEGVVGGSTQTNNDKLPPPL